jgi:peptide/nickel transport system permease protein
MTRRWLVPLRDLVLLIWAVATLLFFLLRATGDPVVALAGADATEEQLAALRAQFGLDQPLPIQYLSYIVSLARFDFGVSMASGVPALTKVMEMLPATLLLSGLALSLTLLLSIPLGAWLGARHSRARRSVAALVFVAQGTPGFVVGLLLIQIFAVNLGWLPAMGYETPLHWILPPVALSAYLAPKLTRVLAAGVQEAMEADYITTARAAGATDREALWRYAVPNALLGSAALFGTQFAFLIGGTVVTEMIFSWPGIGWLLIEATVNLDFPVVQAVAVFVALFVFVINALTQVLFGFLDPRIRRA